MSTDNWAAYAPPGALLFLRGTTLMRQPFDPAGLSVTGDPAPVAEDLAQLGSNAAGCSVSHTGALVYTTGQAATNRRLVWVDRRGGVTPLALAPGIYDSPALSPDRAPDDPDRFGVSPDAQRFLVLTNGGGGDGRGRSATDDRRPQRRPGAEARGAGGAG